MLAGNLEYVMSSLPNLSFQNTEELRTRVSTIFNKYNVTPKTSGNLVSILDAEAVKFLSPKQFKIFQHIQLNNIHNEVFQQTKNSVLSAFSKFILHVKRELKAYRIARKSNEDTTKINYELLGDLSENPLEAEVQLLQQQWNKLEELSMEHYADFEALVLYKLKLLLLLRWWSFDPENGFEIFTQTINSN